MMKSGAGGSMEEGQQRFIRTATVVFLKLFFGCIILGLGHASRSASLEKEGLLLTNINNVRRASETNISASGIKAGLFYKPLLCPPEPAENISSHISPRLKELRCAIRRGKARALSLENRKQSKESADELSLNKEPSVWSQSLASGNNYESRSWPSDGEYVMSFEIGTPTRRYRGIVDTGSDLTWIQCKKCISCYDEPDPYFQPSRSASYDEVGCENYFCRQLSNSFCNIFTDRCHYYYLYGDRSHSIGTLSRDSLTLKTTGGDRATLRNFVFGCGHDNSGTFSDVDGDGVVGLGQGALSLSSQFGSYFANKFSYCLISRGESRQRASPIYFGDLAVPSGDGVQYTPIVRNEDNPTYYYVNFTGISIGGHLLDIPSSAFALRENGRGGTIIDSGTTITHFLDSILQIILREFRSLISYPTRVSQTGLDLCYDISEVSHPRFPSLTFHLQGADLDFPLNNYFVTEDTDDTLCLLIGRSGGRMNIIGNVQQQNFHILYDLENQQMAFRATTCDQE